MGSTDDARRSGRGSSTTDIGLVVLAECSFAGLVALALGRPPEAYTTIGFGLAMAAALALQRRVDRRQAEVRSIGDRA